MKGCVERVCCERPVLGSLIREENSLKQMRLSLSVSRVVNKSRADFLTFWNDWVRGLNRRKPGEEKEKVEVRK